MWHATLISHPQKVICTALSDFDDIFNVLLLMFYQLLQYNTWAYFLFQKISYGYFSLFMYMFNKA